MAVRVVLHVDFDYFYAQCEEARRPGLRGRPVAVCVFSGRGGDSGAVATANYEARGHGVRSGMPISLARSRLSKVPGAEFLPADFGHYGAVSEAAMRVIRGHADVFEYVGRDEAYLDVTARTGGDYGAAARLAQRLKNAVRAETRLTCSVGVSPNRLLSKMASDYKKPDGLTVVRPEAVGEFLGPLAAGKIPGVGAKTAASLERMGVRTVADLGEVGAQDLQRAFGRAAGAMMYRAARGEDDTPVAERGPESQCGRIATLPRDSADYAELRGALAGLCAQVRAEVAQRGLLFRTVGVLVVRSDLSQATRSRTLRSPASGLAELESAAASLLRAALEGGAGPARRLGVTVSGLSDARGQSSMDSYI